MAGKSGGFIREGPPRAAQFSWGGAVSLHAVAVNLPEVMETMAAELFPEIAC